MDLELPSDLRKLDDAEWFFNNNKEKLICIDEIQRKPVIIDEIQRIPALLNEVHWMITNKNIRFILSVSSPRKILRSGANLLGGRALRYELYPLISREIPDFDLNRALNHGLLPRHYLSKRPEKLISAYIGSYMHIAVIPA
ncbi:MAG: AAA family ATPase [Bacteroidota bacterium]|nr:AAA family ATPase [Bacteroidota bacterium]